MIEELISTDLAALAAHDRQHIGPLVLPQPESEARARFVVPWQAAVASGVVATSSAAVHALVPSRHHGPRWFWPTPEAIDPLFVGAIIVTLTALAFTLATRIVVRRDVAAASASATGAAWAGSAATLLCAVGAWLAIQNPGNTLIAHDWPTHRYLPPHMVAAYLAAIVSSAVALGSMWRGTIGAASATRLAIVRLLGIASILVMFGIMWFACDYWGWREVFSPYRVDGGNDLQWNPQVVVARWAIGGSLAGVVGTTVAVAVACMRERSSERARLLALLEHWSVVPIALVLGIATMTLESVIGNDQQALHFGQRVVLVTLGTLAVTLLVATWALRRRRRALVRVPADAPRGTTRLAPWLVEAAPIILAVATAGVLVEADVRAFTETPQLALVVVLVVMAMLGLVLPRRISRSRPIADLIAAVAITVVGAVSFWIAWQRHQDACVRIDKYLLALTQCSTDDTLTSPSFVVVAWTIVLAVSGVVAYRLRRFDPKAWNPAAKILAVIALVTWVGLGQFSYYSRILVGFHYLGPWPEGLAMGMLHRAQSQVLLGYPHVGSELTESQWNALKGAVMLSVFVGTIVVASVRERRRPSRWLSIVEAPAVIPFGVVGATACVVLASACEDTDSASWFATCATIAAVVAFASMSLRRRRREALS